MLTSNLSPANNYPASCSKVLLQNLIFPQPVTKFPALYETQSFIVVFTRS